MTASDNRRVRRMERRAFPYDDPDAIREDVLEAIVWAGLPADIARWRAAADAGDVQAASRLAAIREALA